MYSFTECQTMSQDFYTNDSQERTPPSTSYEDMAVDIFKQMNTARKNATAYTTDAGALTTLSGWAINEQPVLEWSNALYYAALEYINDIGPDDDLNNVGEEAWDIANFKYAYTTCGYVT